MPNALLTIADEEVRLKYRAHLVDAGFCDCQNVL